MANQMHKEMMGNEPPSGGRPTGVKGGDGKGMKVKPGFKTGLPGKSGPNRSAGVSKVKQYAQSEGL